MFCLLIEKHLIKFVLLIYKLRHFKKYVQNRLRENQFKTVNFIVKLTFYFNIQKLSKRIIEY